MKTKKTALLASVMAAAVFSTFAGNVYAEDLAAKVESNSQRTAGNVATIRIQSNLLGEADQAIKTNRRNITANSEAIKAQAERINDTRRYGRENRELITSNTKAINANQKELAGQKAEIERIAKVANPKLSERVANNTQRINNNAAAIERIGTQNTAKLKQLEHKVNNLNKEVKRGLASQAALAGLFQPYNVGKLNVSAAERQAV